MSKYCEQIQDVTRFDRSGLDLGLGSDIPLEAERLPGIDHSISARDMVPLCVGYLGA